MCPLELQVGENSIVPICVDMMQDCHLLEGELRVHTIENCLAKIVLKVLQ